MSNICFKVRSFPVFLTECNLSEYFFPMNTDASNVEDINVPQIIERVSMSCIASFEERSNIFRNRSFTLFKKNDRDFRERFHAAAVSESISSSMTNLSCTGLPVLMLDISPDFHTWEYHLSSMFHSEEFDELTSIVGFPRTFWLSDLVFSTQADAVDASTFGSLTRYRDTKFIMGFDFAVSLSSPASSCVLFDIALRQSMELKWLMLNKHKRWFRSSRVKFPFVSVSCELVLGVNVFDFDLGVQLDFIKQPIKSNSAGSGKHVSLYDFFPLWSSWTLLRCLQTRTTKLPYREEFTFEERKSTLFRSSIFPWIFFHIGDLYGSLHTWWFWCVFPWRTVTIRSHKSSAGFPSILNPAIQRNDFRFCWTVWNWSQFLARPTSWDECMTSEKA